MRCSLVGRGLGEERGWAVLEAAREVVRGRVGSPRKRVQLGGGFAPAAVRG
jgi:hypothetical protein